MSSTGYTSYGIRARRTRRSSTRTLLVPIAIALIAIIVVSGGSSQVAFAASPNKADVSTATTKLKIIQDPLENKWDYDGSHITTRYRWNTSKTSGNLVYCICPGVAHGPFEGESKDMPVRLLRASDFKSNALYEACLAALYYAPGGPGYESDEGSTGGLIGRKLFPDEDYKGGGFSKKDRFGCAHTLMGFYYNDCNWDKSYPRSDWQPAPAFKKWFTKEMIPERWGGSGSASYGQRALEHFNDQDMLENGGYTVEAWKDSVYLVMTGSDESLQDLLTFVDAPRGPIKLEKKSADEGITKDNPCYSLKGAEYTVYSDSALKHKIATIVTDASGKGELENIVTGTYYVKETSPGKGYKLDPTTYTVKVKKDVGGSFTSKEEPIVDELQMLVEKDGLGETDGVPQGEAKLEGAEFSISFYCGQYGEDNLPETPARTWVVKTNAQGKVPIGEIESLKVSGPDFYTHGGKVVFPLGTVCVQETKAPLGYQLADSAGNAPQPAVVNITEDAAKHAVAKRYLAPRIEDAPKLIGVRIWKIDEMLGVPQAQGDASLEGAEFSIINKSAQSVNVGGTFYAPDEECLAIKTEKTADGFVAQAKDALPFGNYLVREKTPPEGYLPNEDWSAEIVVDQDTEHGAVFDFADKTCADMVKRGGIRVPKIDRELGEALPLGAATLEGAEFTLRLDSEQPVIVDGALFKPGEDVKTIATDAEGVAKTGDKDLPYGTYTVRESKAPVGYVLNEQWSMTVEIREDGKVYETKQADDQVIRGDVRFNKVHEDTMARLGSIPFLVTSKTTGEKHVLVTDENGNLDTSAAWAKHAESTNANDRVIASIGEGHDGQSTDSPQDQATDGQPDTPDSDGSADDESQDAGQADDSVIEDSSSQSPSDEDEQAGGSGSTDADADATQNPDSQEGENAVGTGETTPEIDADKLLKAIAKSLGAETATVPDTNALAKRIADAGAFTDVEFTVTIVDGTGSHEVALIATLQEDGSVVVRDADTDDEVAVLETDEGNASEEPGDSSDPSGGDSPGGSSPSTGDTAQSTSEEQPSSSEQDDPTPQNAQAGGGDGTRSDANAHVEPIDDEEGESSASSTAIESSMLDPHAGIWFNGRTDKTTTPDDSLGALPYDTYTFEELRSDSNKGLRLVEFEVTISRPSYDIDLGTVDDKPISLSTELKSENGSHMAPAAASVKLVDSVTCVNVKPGKRYELVGTLIDKADGTQVSEPVKQEFEAESDTQTVDVAFEVDTSSLSGHSLVAYQELYEEGTLVAEHKDIDDADETVCIPHIATTLTGKGGAKDLICSKKLKLTDRVDYANLEPHRTYTLKASLHRKSAEGADLGIATDANGEEIRGEATFEPQTQNGSTTVTFSFNATKLKDCNLVAFEELFIGKTLIAAHADIEDESQAVRLAPHEPEKTPAPDKPQETVTPGKPAPAGGGSYDKTGNVLGRSWLVLIILALFCAIVWPCALYERKPTYAPWTNGAAPGIDSTDGAGESPRLPWQ